MIINAPSNKAKCRDVIHVLSHSFWLFTTFKKAKERPKINPERHEIQVQVRLETDPSYAAANKTDRQAMK